MSAARLSPTRCALAVGEPIPFMDSSTVLRFDYSRVTRVLSTSCGSSGEPAVFAHIWLHQCRMLLRPHLYCLPSRFTIVRYLYWFLGLCGVWSGVFCSVCADCADDSSAGSCVCLAQGCRCGVFFPNSAVFALVLGNSVLAYGILAIPLLFLGYAYGVAFFWLRLPILRLSLSCGSWPCGV